MRRADRLPPLLVAGAVALAMVACGDDSPAPANTGPSPAAAAAAAKRKRALPPAICRGPLRVTVTGTVASPQATELSGLVASRRQPGVLWSHNDSGDRARVFGLRADGSVVADADVTGAEAVDWEDIALGADPGGHGDALYLADIGDNGAARPSIDVYRVPEPAPGASATAPAVRFRLHYPDGAHDAETLLVDPRGGRALTIVTKSFTGHSGVYVARSPVAGGETTLRRVGSLDLGAGGAATAGSVSGDGRVVAVRTYSTVFAWARKKGSSLAATLRRKPCVVPTGVGLEGQGEAIALARRGGSFYTVPEGQGASIRRYAR
jgi:hypothetical protein